MGIPRRKAGCAKSPNSETLSSTQPSEQQPDRDVFSNGKHQHKDLSKAGTRHDRLIKYKRNTTQERLCGAWCTPTEPKVSAYVDLARNDPGCAPK